MSLARANRTPVRQRERFQCLMALCDRLYDVELWLVSKPDSREADGRVCIVVQDGDRRLAAICCTGAEYIDNGADVVINMLRERRYLP